MDKRTTDHILNILRSGTITWHERNDCLNRGRRKKVVGKTKDGKDKTLWERQCDGCEVWHLLKNKSLQVDHIDEVGPFNGNFDDYVRRMYCDRSNLQALCFSCHAKKTSKFNSSLRYQRKNKDALEAL